MASFSRRPGTRSHPSSTQEAYLQDFPPLQLDDGNNQEQHVLTQVEEFGRVNVSFSTNENEYRPQLDNPSQILPDDDDDYALKAYMASQDQISQRFDEEVQQEFELDFNEESSVDDNDKDVDDNNNNNVPPNYTQNTLDAASILVGGFEASVAVNNTATVNNHATATRNNQDEDVDSEFMRKYHEFNRKHGIDIDLPTALATVAAVAPVNDDDVLAKQISSGLRKDGIAGLSPDERAHVENCTEGKNNKKYIQNQTRLEQMFFDTIKRYGGHLTILATDEKVNPFHTVERGMIDKRFYSVVGGEKNPDKHKIFNDCLVLCSQKWFCTTGKNKGQKLQPSTFDKYLEQLTIVFAEKGIKYNYANDFNKNGDFHGVVKSMWSKIREKNPSFGTGDDRARTDPNLYRKFIQAISDRKICPYDDPEHLVLCVIFVFGFYLGLRGSTEHMNLMVDQLYIGEYSMEDGPDLAGLRWGGVKVPFSKMKQLKLSNTRLERDQDVVLSFVENPDPVWDPWQVLCFFIDHCHPRATKVYARILDPESKEAKNLQKEFGKPIWFAEGGKGSNWNMGPTKHRELCKMIAKLAGVEKWESCTGHALRALCITHCLQCGLSNAEVAAKVRHASINSSKTYAQETTKRKANRMAAMNPSGTLTNKKRKASVNVGVKTDTSIPMTAAAVAPEVENDIVDISEMQPMLAKNRGRFKTIVGFDGDLKTPAKPMAMAKTEEENKENESPSIVLKRLEMENKILRLQQENQRMKEELTRSSSAPPNSHHRHSGSRSGSSSRSRRFDGSPEYSDNERRRSRKYRQSYPPTNRGRSPSPSPRRYKRRNSRNFDSDSDGEFNRGYHGRY